MKWSWKITRLAGIDIYMHATFLLLVAWIAFSYWITERSLLAMLDGVLFLLTIFACVVLHELGHALAARKFGIPTRDITLLPIGGVARLERMPEKPAQELWVALAGPLVNVVIASILFIGLLFTGSLQPLTNLSVSEGNFLERVMVVNVSLVLFNLIPAFPMDGGRVVRALLAIRLEYSQATRIAAAIGQTIAFIMGIVGLLNNISLLLIAAFIWISASQESNQVQVKTEISKYLVHEAMLTDFHTLSPTDPIAHPAQMLLNGSQHDFPVVVDNHVVGLLTREEVIRNLAKHDDRSLVSYVMQKDVCVIDPDQSLDKVMLWLQANSQSILPVVQNGVLVGIITLENIEEFLLIRNAKRLRKLGNTPTEWA